MHRLHIFLAADDQPQTPEAQAETNRIMNDFPGAELIITNHADASGRMPRGGDRPLSEYKTDPDHEDPLFPGSHTHSRAGGWMVVGEPEVFPGDSHHRGEYDEVVFCRCAYEPLPEAENPWIPVHRPYPQVTLDSFGGDVAAFEEWQTTEHGQAVRARETAQA